MSSSPRSVGGTVREGTRIVLREITATLHNSPPMQSPRRKSGNDSTASKIAEHEVKVRFAREFADVGSIATCTAPESLSSASSFQSLSSTLSTKSSSGISADTVPPSPSQDSNASYVNPNISGVEDLILGCAEINLDNDEDCSYDTLQNSQDLSHDQTFASAIDETTPEPNTDANVVSLTESDSGAEIPGTCIGTPEIARLPVVRTPDIEERPIIRTICIREPLPVATVPTGRRNSFAKVQESLEKSISPRKCNDLNSSDHQTNSGNENGVVEASLPKSCGTEEPNLNTPVPVSPAKAVLDVSSKKEEYSSPENNTSEAHALSLSFVPSALNSTATLEFDLSGHAQELSLPSIPTFSSLLNSTDSTRLSESDATGDQATPKSQLVDSPYPVKNSNVIITSSPQIVLKSSPEETQPQKNIQTEEVRSSTCNNIARDEQSGEQTYNLNDTPVARPKAPEVQQDSSTSIHKEVESSDIVLSTVEHSPPKDDSLQVNVTPSRKEEKIENTELRILNRSQDKENSDDLEKADGISLTAELGSKEIEAIEELSLEEKLDTTLTLHDVSLSLEAVSEGGQYTEFQPQRQSTTLATLNIEQPNFEEFKSAAEHIADDIFKSTLENTEENDPFVSATSEIFQDPSSFDFLINLGNTKTINRLRSESLYVKFDPLVGDTSMLPQGNTPPMNEEQNGKSESIPASIGTPKRNPAIAAIDRLLFYSPITSNMTQKTDEPQEKLVNKEQPPDEPKTDTPLIADIDMSKDIELVRVTVLQLEEQLEKQKKEYQAELEKQKVAYQEKLNKLQAQMAQEVKSKTQMTVVVDEYEKSISRLLTERERDRTNYEQELAKVQEELQTTNVHLTNTEAAFNDVHQKYERLKGVVSAYKSNESVLKESIQENMETIKGLETRYDHLKNHATTQLEKANFELETIRKQHEDETVKLHALLRKAELKSNSLSELAEQKAKENKELTQILDEVIARVGHQNAE